MEISIFFIGFFFGFCVGVSILALHRTSKDLDETNRIVKQIEIRDDLIARQRETIKRLNAERRAK